MTDGGSLSPEEVREALRQWHRDGERGALVKLRVVRQAIAGGASARRATNQLLHDALEQLEGEQPEQARLLKDHYLDEVKMALLARRWRRAESRLYEVQKQGLAQLTALILQREGQVEGEQQAGIASRLPPVPYSALVGVEPALHALTSILAKPGPPWLLSIEGIGGIGKTSLADALLRHVVARGLFHDFAWVSAKSTLFNLGGSLSAIAQPALTLPALVETLVDQLIPGLFGATPFSEEAGLKALQQRLQAAPHLIVIDNLETVPDVERLLPMLRRLQQPTRFLLTSRESRYGEGDIYHFPVPELSAEDALRLIRQEARLANLSALLAASDGELLPIYEAVGGNPLALRLVVGQCHVHSLPALLHDFVAARGSAEPLYRYIYQRAWEQLDEAARSALLAMPLMPPAGGRFEDLVAVSGLEEPIARVALGRLVRQNLIDVRGDLYGRRYSIHNLTRSFLHEAITLWS